MKKVNDNSTVYWLLMQVMFQAKHRINQIAEAHGLTVMQSNTLTMLKEDEPLPMSTLSNHFMCDASNVTGIADRLESQGLIERRDHPTDRRVKLITLTSKGAALRDAIVAETVTAEATRLDPVLTSAERKTLHDLLKRILNSQPATR